MHRIRRTAAVVAVLAVVGTAGVAADAANSDLPAPPSSVPAGAPVPGVAPPRAAPQVGGARPSALHPFPTQDTTFVAVPLCKVADTAKLAKGAFAEYSVAATDLSSQGGSSTGCGIPSYAVSVAGRVQATAATTNGNLTVSTAGVKGHVPAVFDDKGVPGTSAFTQPVRSGGGKALRITAAGSSAHVIVWVNGYYAEPIAGLVYTAGGTNAVYAGSSGILSVTNIAVGQARVTLDRDVTYCSISASSYFGQGVYANALGFATNTVTVYTWYLSATTHQEVYSNNYAYLSIVC